MSRLAQPHNAYNIFFMLERQKLLVEQMTTDEKLFGTLSKESFDLGGYDGVTLPNLPSRYDHLEMPPGWFVPGKNSKRKHVKSNGNSEYIFKQVIVDNC